MDLEITERWYDHRLAADYKTRKLAVREKIWQPKITFVIGNKICPDISAENADETQFWRGTSNGSVFYSERFEKFFRDFDVSFLILIFVF